MESHRSGRQRPSDPGRRNWPARDSGQVLIWPGRALYIGALLENEAHAHHAVQVSVAFDGVLWLQAAPNPRWSPYRAVVTDSDQPHRLRCTGRVAQIYLDPESTAGLALRRWMGPAGIRSIDCDDTAVAALAAALTPREQRPAPSLVVPVIDRITQSRTFELHGDGVDPRVQKALSAVQALPGHDCSLSVLAGQVGLSASRLGSLFRRDIGIPFRRYVLWLRLIDAVQALASQSNLTTAAHHSGFADSAHLSRTFRRMFGMPPSLLRSRHVAIYDFAGGCPAAPSWTHPQLRSTLCSDVPGKDAGQMVGAHQAR